MSSLFSKPCERFNCGEKKKERGRESTAKKRDWQLLLRFRTTKMCGRGRGRQGKLLETGNSIDRREIGEERTNHRWPTRSKENHDKPILFRFLSLSVSIFRNEPMSKWWYYWLIRLGSELRNRRGIEERKIHAIVSTQSYLVSSLHRNSVSRPETSILFSISRKSGEKRQEEEEEEEGVSACSV